MKDHRILFMGTPEFAVGTLDALVQAGYDIAGVVTAPDKPAGRGRQLRSSAVKQRALELGLPVIQPERLKAQEFQEELDRIDASLYIVVAFRMLPEMVWAKPTLGTINLHGSLLPDYRGAAPINWAVINGEERTGVTTFRIQHEIDTGDILLQEELSIGPDETAGELHDRMMVVGAELMVRTVKGLLEGGLEPVPQNIGARTPPTAPKIGALDARIDFNRPAKRVHDLVRGMSPFPGAWCELHEGDHTSHFKVLRTRRTGDATRGMPGTVAVERGQLCIACADEWVEAMEVQVEGKRRMTAAEFVRGLRSSDGLSMH